MKDLITFAKNELLQSKDSLCFERVEAYTQIYQEMAAAPIPIKRAHAFARHLATMTLDLESNPIFAGNISSQLKAWSLRPEYGWDIPTQAVIEHPHFEGMLDSDVIPQKYRDFWEPIAKGGTGSIGHLTINQEKILQTGLSSVIEEIQQYSSASKEQIDYREAMLISLQAVIDWGERYRLAAISAAQQTDDAQLHACYVRIANALEQVPAKPARNLFEALQCLILAHYAIHLEGHNLSVSPGRLDQVLAPYYNNGSDAEDLLCAYLLKIAANAVWGSFSKTQAITLGGSDPFGSDDSNPLTLLILQACDKMRLPDPHVFVRWHANLAQEVKDLSYEMISHGVSMPLLVGDEATIQGLVNAGVESEDAADYVIIGCNEIGIPGKMIYQAVNIVPLQELAAILSNPAKRKKIHDLESLFLELENETESVLRNHIRGHESYMQEEAAIIPTPFTSAFMDGCIEKGCDLNLGMQYPYRVVGQQGTTNLVNAITAIEEIVFQQRTTTLDELVSALEANFVGYDTLHRQLLNASKWGNDVPLLNEIAARWMMMRDRILRKLEIELNTPRHLNCHVTRSLNYVFGRKIGATPDGRLSGEPLSDSIGAVTGTQTEGPTALLSSVCGLDPSVHWDGGYNLNLTLQTSDSTLLAENLIETFFGSGGQELQINALDEETLKDAQKNPDQYANLLVRVAGFSARFIDLSPEQQHDIIQRAQSINP